MTEAPPPHEAPHLRLPDGSEVVLPPALYRSLLREAERFGLTGEDATIELLQDRLGRLAPEFVRKLKALPADGGTDSAPEEEPAGGPDELPELAHALAQLLRGIPKI